MERGGTGRRIAMQGFGVIVAIGLSLSLQACPGPYDLRHEDQWDSREQVWRSEESQVKIRAAQSRAFDTVDERRILEAVVAVMQDLDFKVEVLDEELGIVSGKKFVETERSYVTDPTYFLYQPDTLLFLTRNYHSWGPFLYRNNLVRITVTVRKLNEAQLVVRASAQYYLRAVEDPTPYQKFFRSLEQTLFLQGQAVE